MALSPVISSSFYPWNERGQEEEYEGCCGYLDWLLDRCCGPVWEAFDLSEEDVEEARRVFQGRNVIQRQNTGAATETVVVNGALPLAFSTCLGKEHQLSMRTLNRSH